MDVKCGYQKCIFGSKDTKHRHISKLVLIPNQVKVKTMSCFLREGKSYLFILNLILSNIAFWLICYCIR